MTTILPSRTLRALSLSLLAIGPSVAPGGENWPAFQNGGAVSLPAREAASGVLESVPVV